MWFSRVFSDLEKQYGGERYHAKGFALTQGFALNKYNLLE
jgi:hypothetical protein